MIKLLFYSLICLLTISCSQETDSFKYYFFPVDDFDTPKVYVYSSPDKPDKSIYYAIKSINNSGEKYLHTEFFDNKFNLIESIRMRITNSGAFADEFTTQIDSQKFTMKIYSDTMMVWDSNFKSKFLFEASINRPEQRNLQVIKKVRSFTGKRYKFKFENIDYQTIELSEDMFVNDGSDAIILKKSTINYARGLGIVSINISENNNKTEYFALKRIINFNEWKSMQTK